MCLTWEELKAASERLLPQLEDHDIAGRTVIVTGASAGVGYEVTKYMANYGASKIILACRNEAKGREAITRIIKETGRDARVFECWPLDFASLTSVQRFAKRYNESGLPLHILIHNAVFVMTGQWHSMSEDSFDLILQVNYLAPALLSILLYPVLAQTGALDQAQPARLIWVISEGSPLVPFNESADFICLLTCHEYARRIPPCANIAVATACPGVVATELGQDVDGNDFDAVDIEKSTHVRPRTAEEGARTIVLAATYPVEAVWRAGMHDVPLLTSMQEMDLMCFCDAAADEVLQEKLLPLIYTYFVLCILIVDAIIRTRNRNQTQTTHKDGINNDAYCASILILAVKEIHDGRRICLG